MKSKETGRFPLGPYILITFFVSVLCTPVFLSGSQDKTREEILKLGKLDLELPFSSLGPLSENIKDQLGSVNNLQIYLVRDRFDLGGI